LTIKLNPINLDDVLIEKEKNDVDKLLDTFHCRRDLDLERFLKQDAIQFHKKHRSRTYLFLSDDCKKVLAYVTLGIKSMNIPEANALTNRVKKEMDVYKGVSQSYLIGQLGKSDGVEKGIGPELIAFSLSVFEKSFRALGCRTVRVDCKQELIKFYEDNGFILISPEKDEDELYHMVLLF